MAKRKYQTIYESFFGKEVTARAALDQSQTQCFKLVGTGDARPLQAVRHTPRRSNAQGGSECEPV
jgi:hypothetical protein